MAIRSSQAIELLPQKIKLENLRLHRAHTTLPCGLIVGYCAISNEPYNPEFLIH